MPRLVRSSGSGCVVLIGALHPNETWTGVVDNLALEAPQKGWVLKYVTSNQGHVEPLRSLLNPTLRGRNGEKHGNRTS